MKTGILALQGDVREHARMLESAGATPVAVKRADELEGVDALVVPGGESTTIGMLAHRFGLLEPLRARIASGLPVLGTCAGLILLASEVVGRQGAPYRLGVLDVAVRRNAYGRQVDSFETAVDVEGLESPLRGAFIRAPIVEQTGPAVQVLGRHEDSPVCVQQGRVLACTFHPEIAGDDRLHRLFLKVAGG